MRVRDSAGKIKILLLPALAAVFLCASPAAAEYFTIENFRADIFISADSSFLVRETIETRFISPRHGIYRDLPFRYTDSLGRKIRTPLTVLSVTDELDRKRRYRTMRSGDTLRVRIGHPRKFVNGRQVYVITYKVENAILFLDDHDELYWNVTGTGWATTIDNASSRVSLEGGREGLHFKTRCFTGSFGSREESCSFIPSEGGGEFAAARKLHAHEGLTLVLGWDKGVVREPGLMRKWLWSLNLKENWIFLFPVLVFIFMYRHWRRRGRDPYVGDTVMVMYKPPEEKGRPLLPAETGSLIDEKLDARDITASIVNLAVKKYITIEEIKTEGLIFDKTDYKLNRLRDADEALPEFEAQLMKYLFSGSSGSIMISDLKYKFYKNVDDLKKTVFAELKRIGYYSASPLKVKRKYFAAAFVIIIFGGLLTAFLGSAQSSLMPGDPGVPKTIAVVILSGLSVALFAPFMPARTRLGAQANMRLKGFEEFLSRAEKDRLERMKDKNLFEKYLPYAIALDVSDRWAAAFEEIYQEAPDWYISRGGSIKFHPSSFNRSLGTALSSMGSAMYAAPRSSGGSSSGGGFSGGGFGGGGGGSW